MSWVEKRQRVKSWWSMSETEAIFRLSTRQMCMGTGEKYTEGTCPTPVQTRGYQPLCMGCTRDCMILNGDEGTWQNVICFDFTTGIFNRVSSSNQ